MTRFLTDLRELATFLRHYARGTKYAQTSIVILSIAGFVSGLSTTGLLGVINRMIQRAGETTPFLFWSFIGLCILVPLMRMVSSGVLAYLTSQSVYHLRLRLSRKILGAPLRHLERLGSHRLLATLTDDIPTVSSTLSTLPNLCLNAAIVAGSMGYLLWLAPVVFCIVFAFIVVGTISYQMPVQWATSYFHRRREKWDEAFENIQILTKGTKELKQHRRRRRDFLRKKLEPSLDEVRRLGLTGTLIYTATSVWGNALFFVVIGVVLLVVPSYLSVTSEVLTGYTIILLYMMQPLEMLLGVLPNISRAAVSVRKIRRLGLSLNHDRIAELPGSDGTETRRTAASSPEDAHDDRAFSHAALTLDGVSYTYTLKEAGALEDDRFPSPDLPYSANEETGAVTNADDEDVDVDVQTDLADDVHPEPDRFTVGPIDLTVEPGELVFLTGGNGSGKTTLAKIILGLYRPDAGEIRVGDQTVTEENRDAYRQLFSVVFSDSFVFESLLGIGAKNLTEEARRYLRKLRIDHKVDVENGELSTTDLSKGQRKRLALLTAYLEDRPIYVFDEWAADQDPDFKSFFYHEILVGLKKRGKSVLAISHDNRYYDLADHIVKLENGQRVATLSGEETGTVPLFGGDASTSG
jgi:putative ATP-binding cassette transporter